LLFAFNAMQLFADRALLISYPRAPKRVDRDHALRGSLSFDPGSRTLLTSAAIVTGFAMPAITIIIFSARHAHLHYVQSTCIGDLTLIRTV
jgi:hypothetical protein